MIGIRYWAQTGIALAIGASMLASEARAATLTAADRAWIAACVADRKDSGLRPAALKRYCVCMQAIVEDNQPFESITALERAYPPAHQACRRTR